MKKRLVKKIVKCPMDYHPHQRIQAACRSGAIRLPFTGHVDGIISPGDFITGARLGTVYVVHPGVEQLWLLDSEHPHLGCVRLNLKG